MCNHPYDGVDCSINILIPPTIETTFFLKKIEVFNKITNLIITGGGFIEGPNLTCSIREENVSSIFCVTFLKSFLQKQKHSYHHYPELLFDLRSDLMEQTY